MRGRLNLIGRFLKVLVVLVLCFSSKLLFSANRFTSLHSLSRKGKFKGYDGRRAKDENDDEFVALSEERGGSETRWWEEKSDGDDGEQEENDGNTIIKSSSSKSGSEERGGGREIRGSREES